MANEKRLIDANALIKEANAEGAYGYVDAKQIADAPTINAVKVTRCRNCIGRSTWYNDAKYGGFSGVHGRLFRRPERRQVHGIQPRLS